MHSCQRIYKLHSPLHSLSNTHTHTRWPLTYTCNTTTQIIQNSHSSSPKKHQHICIHIHGCMQETQQHTLTPSGISGPRKVFPLTLSENWQAGQTTNNYPQSTGRREQKKKRSKTEKTNRGDVIRAKWQALCEKDWRVYSYLLLPGFQYQHHRKHIRCFSFRWLTHKDEHKLPSVFAEN